GIRYNYRVAKLHCRMRAEWRFQPGKRAERLSAYYRLDCDYGTAVMICWQNGGIEPVYLCEDHAKESGRPDAVLATDRDDTACTADAAARFTGAKLVTGSKAAPAQANLFSPSAGAGQ